MALPIFARLLAGGLHFREKNSMHGVVSLLDSTYYRVVEDLWAELERAFAVDGVYVTPYPHFSYQVAPQYDIEGLEAILRHFAFNSAAFQVRTTGLGIFTGVSPVLYISVVRSPELTRFHKRLWQKISQVGSGMLAPIILTSGRLISRLVLVI